MAKPALFGVLMLLGVLSTGALLYKNTRSTSKPAALPKPAAENRSWLLSTKSAALRKYAAANGYSTRFCFMVDMRLHPGKKRFFVMDMTRDSVLAAGLVAHGSGSDRGDGELKFSNTPGSLCTSLGRYKIGASYNGQFGLAYKMYGLDKTNSRAFERFVVLHSHACVPELEVYPAPVCLSWGCPTVSPVFLQQLKDYISRSEKPLLLEIFY